MNILEMIKAKQEKEKSEKTEIAKQLIYELLFQPDVTSDEEIVEKIIINFHKKNDAWERVMCLEDEKIKNILGNTPARSFIATEKIENEFIRNIYEKIEEKLDAKLYFLNNTLHMLEIKIVFNTEK